MFSDLHWLMASVSYLTEKSPKLQYIWLISFLQITLFLSELSQAPIGVTVCGLFMITRESAVTVNITQENQLLQ